MKARCCLCMVFAIIVSGCSDNEGARTVDASSSDAATIHDGSRRDAAHDATSTADGASSADASSDADALLGDASLADAALADAAPTDGAPGDAEVDASVPDATVDDLGRVTCRATSDCETSQTCNAAAPGGVCLGCVDEFDCPDPANMGCFGATACYWKCQADGDCNLGKRCDGLGRCVIRECQTGSEECPAPYVCSKSNGDPGLCERPKCEMGTCPSPLVCQGSHCVEP